MNFFIMLLTFATAQPVQHVRRSIDPIFADFMSSYLGGPSNARPAEYSTYEKRFATQHDIM